MDMFQDRNVKIGISVVVFVVFFLLALHFIKRPAVQPNLSSGQMTQQPASTLPTSKEQKITENVNGVEIDVSYAVFTNAPDIVNTRIKEHIDDIVQNVRDIAKKGTLKENTDLFLTSSYEVAQANDQYISLVQMSQEDTGGAHPNQYYMTFNFDTKSGKEIKLADLYQNDSKYLDIVKPKVKAAVLAVLKKQLVDNGDKKTDPQTLLFGDVLAVDADLFETFTFGEKYITFYFAPYDIAPYSTGPIIVKIDR